MVHYHDEPAVDSHADDRRLLGNVDDDDEYRDYNSTERHGSTFEPTTPSAAATKDEQAESAWLAELQTRPWYRRPSIFWLMPLLFLVGAVLGIIGSPLEQLDIQIICKDYLEQHESSTVGISPLLVEDARRMLTDDRCKSSEVLAFAALIQSRTNALRGVLCLLTLAKWTSLSDIYGRKLLLQLAMIALSLAHLITCVLLGLIPGGNFIHPAIFAYIADCTTASTRSVMIGYTVVSFYFGGIIGPYLGGYIVKVTGDLTSVIRVSVTCFTILFLYLIFVPESLRAQYTFVEDEGDDDDIPQPPVSIAPDCTVKQPFVVRVCDSVKRVLVSTLEPLLLFIPGRVPISSKIPSRYVLSLWLVSSFLSRIAIVGVMLLFIPLTNLVYHWTAYEDGMYYSFRGLCNFVVFLGIFPLLQYLYKRMVVKVGKDQYQEYSQNQEETETLLQGVQDDERPTKLMDMAASAPALDMIESIKMNISFVFCGLALNTISYIIVPLFMSVPVLYVAEALNAIAMTGELASTSFLTTIIPSHRTGMALGAVSVSDSVAVTVSGLVYGRIFASTSATIPWLYYFVSAGLSFTAALVFSVVWASYHHVRRR
ncbi:hypothetical protein BG011_006615 [Mortierella polycephala]|uniref:MFS general substrate transporter n=1 Tax=Mortierella polycephala TaxID=41804 RepID=A0A9P6PU80_9FUNG|nr:hypothetical protein BG011_006615 [Mortierella polycephala]